MEQQGLDRNAVLGILLISLLLLVWMLTQTPRPEDEVTTDPTEEVADDAEAEIGPAEASDDVSALRAPTDSLFASAVGGTGREITVVTDRQRAVMSTRGGTFRSLQLLNYRNAATGEPVELVADSVGALAVGFNPPTGNFVDTRTLSFQPVVDGEIFEGDSLVVDEEPREIAFEARIGEGAIRLVYTFTPGGYQIGFRVETPGTNLLDQGDSAYDVTWDGALPFAERAVDQEATQAGAYVRLGGETDVLRLSEEGALDDETRTGQIDWVAVKTKFFVAAMLPAEGTETSAARLSAQQIGEADTDGFAQDYSATIEMPGLAANETAAFTLYLGPLELRRLAALDLYDVVDFGFGETITRPIARYIIAPTLALLTQFIPSFGLAILIFAFLVKLVLWPLTAASYRNAARMRELQPKMAAIKEKYGDDPQKQQEATMAMYREEKINPLGGCLPMLLQYPILISLWRYFQSTLVLRQQGFLWAQDLSAPDPILNLPFNIPFYGDFVAGFTLLMGLSMIVQMKVSMSGSTAIGSQQKVIMYVLPLTFFLFFNRFPSGLSLYYLGFNLLSIVQQRLVNKQVHDKIEAGEDLKPKSSRNGKASTNGKAPNKKARRKPGRSMTTDIVAKAKKGGKRR